MQIYFLPHSVRSLRSSDQPCSIATLARSPARVDRLERAEGKNYNDAGVSAEMQALTRQFGSLHGLSSLLNLAQLGGILFHGAWLARYGLFSKAT